MTVKELTAAVKTLGQQVVAVRNGIDEKTSNIRARINELENRVGRNENACAWLIGAAIVLSFVVILFNLNGTGRKDRIRIQNLENHVHNQTQEIRWLENALAGRNASYKWVENHLAFLESHGRKTHDNYVKHIGQFERRESGYVFTYVRGGRELVSSTTMTEAQYFAFIETKKKEGAALEPKCPENSQSIYIMNGRTYRIVNGVWYTVSCNCAGAMPCN